MAVSGQPPGPAAESILAGSAAGRGAGSAAADAAGGPNTARPPGRLSRWADRVEFWMNALLALMLFVLVACLCWQVYGRYVLNDAPGWTEEVARFLMVWVTMLGSAVVLRRNGHIEVTALVMALPRPLRLALFWLRDAVVLACAGVLVWYGYGLAEIGGQRLTPALEIRMYWPFLAIPISGALMAFFLCVRRIEQDPDEAPRLELI